MKTINLNDNDYLKKAQRCFKLTILNQNFTYFSSGGFNN